MHEPEQSFIQRLLCAGSLSEEWMSFETFLATWAEDRDRARQIERVDNNSGYSKANYRWATRDEQPPNKRNAFLFAGDDHVMPLSRAVQHFGISSALAVKRHRELGWSASRALTMPPRNGIAA